LKGTLNLVDLAGSERLDRSLATGARLKETVAINKSLSSLVDVFVAIGNKQSHIPFRNSKLTYLLQPSLSGDGKTLMMINLSPTEDSYPESLCTLRFASQVNQCELGKPKRQLRDAPAESSDRDTATSTSTSTSTTGSGSSTSALSGSVRSASFSTLSGSASSSASLTNLSRKPSSGNIPLPPSSKSMKR
jgi:kinesin family protein C1